MRSKKKAIQLSLETLLGLTIALVVLAFIVVPLLAKVYHIFFPVPDYVSQQSYNRVVEVLKNLKDGEKAIVPVQLSGYKITTSMNSQTACPPDCVCLCKADVYDTSGKKEEGCAQKLEDITCFKGEVSFNIDPDPQNLIEYPVLEKSGGKVEVGGNIPSNCMAYKVEDCTSHNCRLQYYTLSGLGGEKGQAGPKCEICDLKEAGAASACNIYSESFSITSTNLWSVFYIKDTIAQNSDFWAQCMLDPCRLKEKGINCFWEEKSRKDAAGNDIMAGSCETCDPNTFDCNSLGPKGIVSSFLARFSWTGKYCNSVCGNICFYDGAANTCNSCSNNNVDCVKISAEDCNEVCKGACYLNQKGGCGECKKIDCKNVPLETCEKACGGACKISADKKSCEKKTK